MLLVSNYAAPLLAEDGGIYFLITIIQNKDAL